MEGAAQIFLLDPMVHLRESEPPDGLLAGLAELKTPLLKSPSGNPPYEGGTEARREGRRRERGFRWSSHRDPQAGTGTTLRLQLREQ